MAPPGSIGFLNSAKYRAMQLQGSLVSTGQGLGTVPSALTGPTGIVYKSRAAALEIALVDHPSVARFLGPWDSGTGNRNPGVPPASFDFVQNANPFSTVQHKSATGSSATPGVSFTSTPTQGNLLVAACYSDVSGTAAAITMTSTGWTALTDAHAGIRAIRLFWKIAGAGESTTVTMSATSGSWVCAVAEYATGGLTISAVTDNAQTNASATTQTTPTVTPSASIAAFVVGWVASNAASATWSAEQVNGLATGVTVEETPARAGASAVLFDLACPEGTLGGSPTGTYQGQATASGAAAAGAGAIAVFTVTSGTLTRTYAQSMIQAALAPYFAAGYQPSDFTLSVDNICWAIAANGGGDSGTTYGQNNPPGSNTDWTNELTQFVNALQSLYGAAAAGFRFKVGVEFDSVKSWTGTAAQYFTLYNTAVTTIRSVFPNAVVMPAEFTGSGVGGQYNTPDLYAQAVTNGTTPTVIPRSLNYFLYASGDNSANTFPSLAVGSAVGSFIPQVSPGSNAVNVNTFTGSGVLYATTTLGEPSSGTLIVATDSGPQTVTYTGLSYATYSGTQYPVYTGCSCSGSGVMHTGNSISNAGRATGIVPEIHQFGLLALPWTANPPADQAAMRANWEFQVIMQLRAQLDPGRISMWTPIDTNAGYPFMTGIAFVRMLLDRYYGSSIYQLFVSSSHTDGTENVVFGFWRAGSSAIVLSSYTPTSTPASENLSIPVPRDLIPGTSLTGWRINRYAVGTTVHDAVKSDLASLSNLAPNFAGTLYTDVVGGMAAGGSGGGTWSAATSSSQAGGPYPNFAAMLAARYAYYQSVMEQSLSFAALQSSDNITYTASTLTLTATVPANQLIILEYGAW